MLSRARRLICRALGHRWGARQWMLWQQLPGELRECRRRGLFEWREVERCG